MGLEVGIWASRLGFALQGWDMGLEVERRAGTKEKEKKEYV